MAKGKNKPQASDNGVDTDVMELPNNETQQEPINEETPTGTIEDWGVSLAKGEEKKIDPRNGKSDKPLDKDSATVKDDEQLLAAAQEKEESQGTPSSVLDAMTKGEDNDFSLDEPEKKEGEAELGKDGKPVEKTKEKIIDATEVVSRIAKELEIGDAQTPEQLISSIKEKLSTAKAGADAPVAGIDKVLALSNRDLYKAFLMRNSNFTDERAEKYITERMETLGDEWIDLKAEDVRIDLEAARAKIVSDHVSRETAKVNEAAQFATTARNTVKEIKTIFGKIPLKEHVAQLKEFQAQISTEEGLNAMRNDPKKLTEAMFMLNFGEQILEAFLDKKLSEAEKQGWRKSYKANVTDKIINQSKQREQTEFPNEPVKPSAYQEGGWEN